MTEYAIVDLPSCFPRKWANLRAALNALPNGKGLLVPLDAFNGAQVQHRLRYRDGTKVHAHKTPDGILIWLEKVQPSKEIEEGGK